MGSCLENVSGTRRRRQGAPLAGYQELCRELAVSGPGTFGERSAVSAVQTALTALGNPALTRSNPLERQFRISSAAASTRRRTTRR